jgi:hypothetical protein
MAVAAAMNAARVDLLRRQELDGAADERREEAVAGLPARLDQRRGQLRQDVAFAGGREGSVRCGDGDGHESSPVVRRDYDYR